MCAKLDLATFFKSQGIRSISHDGLPECLLTHALRGTVNQLRAHGYDGLIKKDRACE